MHEIWLSRANIIISSVSVLNKGNVQSAVKCTVNSFTLLSSANLFFCVPLWHEAEPKSEAKGNNVLLKTGVTTINPGDLILWMFGAKNFFIARADSNKTDISERFKDRVQLDPQTGSLTITNISNREYGHYKVQIINEEKTTFRRFNVFDPGE